MKNCITQLSRSNASPADAKPHVAFGSRPVSGHLSASMNSGFTLVEMLVAVGLVVLMMTLFATVFQTATGSMSKQKGLAENDQRARTLVNIIKADLDKRTMRSVVTMTPEEDTPEDTNGDGIFQLSEDRNGNLMLDGVNGQLDAGEDLNGNGILDHAGPDNPATVVGYFSVSENNVVDDTDDVIQFTLATTNVQKNQDQTPLYGRAKLLVNGAALPDQLTYLYYNSNQPEFDDGQVSINDTAVSTFGEVAYFLRNGNLYRRMLLLRSPAVENADPQPMDGTMPIGVAFLPGNYTNLSGPATSGIFWRDFDFSACNTLGFPKFHDVNSLDNTVTDLLGRMPLGNPPYRFGHVIYNAAAASPRTYGLPYEYVSGPAFIGRFTQQETSSANFVYPSMPASGSNYPMTQALTLTNGVVDQYNDAQPARRGEDILMTNVLAFDVQLFDDVFDDFVNVGQNATGIYGTTPTANANGTYTSAPIRNGYYSPASAPRFDSWNSFVDIDGSSPKANSAPQYDLPPFYLKDLGPDALPGRAGIDDDGNGSPDYIDYPTNTIFDQNEIGYPGTDDRRYPLRAIKITIRYFDTASNQIRDVSIIHSLTD